MFDLGAIKRGIVLGLVTLGTISLLLGATCLRCSRVWITLGATYLSQA